MDSWRREVDMFIVLDGELEIHAQDENNVRRSLTILRTRRFSDELDLLSSRRTLVNGRAVSKSLLLRVPRTELQRLLRSEGDIANLLLQATIWRRLGILERAEASVFRSGMSGRPPTHVMPFFSTMPVRAVCS